MKLHHTTSQQKGEPPMHLSKLLHSKNCNVYFMKSA